MANSGYRIVSYVRFGGNDAKPDMILAASQSIKSEVFVLSIPVKNYSYLLKMQMDLCQWSRDDAKRP